MALIRTTDKQTHKYVCGAKVKIEVGPTAKEFNEEDTKFILGPYFKRTVTSNVEVVEPKKKVEVSISEN